VAVHKFQISMPLGSTLPRDRVTNVVHFEHVGGVAFDTDLESMCSDLATMYQARYGGTGEVNVRAYDIGGEPPHVPRANVTKNSGSVWQTDQVREVALCLSFSGANRGDKRRRGRIYLAPGVLGASPAVYTQRPNDATLDWALKFYTQANSSFPDIGGIDWKFGIWSERGQHFTQATQAWVNDDWDTQRRRGLRETKRVTSVREG